MFIDDSSLFMFDLICPSFLIALYTNFEYGSVDDFTQAKYTIFRDIMVMLLLGFGYLVSIRILLIH